MFPFDVGDFDLRKNLFKGGRDDVTMAEPAVMQTWSKQKLTWKKKNLVSGYNPVDASLWIQNLRINLNGYNNQVTMKVIMKLT